MQGYSMRELKFGINDFLKLIFSTEDKNTSTLDYFHKIILGTLKIDNALYIYCTLYIYV